MSQDDPKTRWAGQWEDGSVPWHQEEVHSSILNHGEKLLPSPHRRVLVPLCGKTVDLKWLYDEGHTVVGIEVVEQGVKEFFSEQNLQYVTEELSWGKVFKTEDDRLKMYCCNLFKMDLEHLGKFDAVWDRGSLVAINFEDRESYVKVMKSLVAPDFRYLLNVVQYTPNELFDGPPRNVPTEEVTRLFGDDWDHKELARTTRPKDKVAHWHLETLDIVVLLLTRRA